MKLRIIAAFFVGAVLLAAQGTHTGGGQGASGNPTTTAFLTGDYTNATTSFTSLSGLAFPVVANTNYHLQCNIVWSASAATAGPKLQITGPSSPTALAVTMASAITVSTTGSAAATAFSSALDPLNGATVTNGVNEWAQLSMDLRNGANAGTVQLQAAATGVGTVTVRNASGCQIQ